MDQRFHEGFPKNQELPDKMERLGKELRGTSVPV
jgi:hypothetical protein